MLLSLRYPKTLSRFAHPPGLRYTVAYRVADGGLASDFHARLVKILEDGAWRT